MIPFCENDAGRSKSKRSRQKNDCVVRAIAIATGRGYDEIYDELAAKGRKCGRSTPKKLWQDYLNNVGTRYFFPAIMGQKRMSVTKFVDTYPQGMWVVHIAKHLFACVNGVVFDVNQPRPDACVYAAWKIT